MDTIAVFVQIILYVVGIKLFDDIWKNKKELLSVKNTSISIIIIGTVFCVSLNILINNLLPLLSEIFKNIEPTMNMSLADWIIAIVTGIILAPVLEEIVFRYYLYEKLKVKINYIFSILITSSIFTLVHFYNLTGLIATFCLGIILQLIYIKTKKLFNVIIIHALCNVSLIIIPLLGLSENYITFSIFAIFCLISLILFIKFLKNHKNY